MNRQQHIEPTGEIHEAAALFPMLPDDELAELAEDIKANGLVHPIVLDDEGVLIDGRNRLAACRLAGVPPRFTSLNGHDPVAYILSVNVARRNLTKGQRTLGAVVLKSRLNLDFRWGEKARLAESLDVDAMYVNKAIAVAEHPDLIERVMADQTSRADALSLPEAYKQARERGDAADRERIRREREERDLTDLRANAVDLANSVADGRLTLSEAMAAWRVRQRVERERRERLTRNFVSNVTGVWSVLGDKPELVADDWLPEANTQRDFPLTDHLWTADGLREMARSFERLADAVDARGGRLE